MYVYKDEYDRQVFKKKMLNTTTVDLVYNPEKYKIMNTRSPLLSCDVHNHLTENTHPHTHTHTHTHSHICFVCVYKYVYIYIYNIYI